MFYVELFCGNVTNTKEEEKKQHAIVWHRQNQFHFWLAGFFSVAFRFTF